MTPRADDIAEMDDVSAVGALLPRMMHAVKHDTHWACIHGIASMQDTHCSISSWQLECRTENQQILDDG